MYDIISILFSTICIPHYTVVESEYPMWARRREGAKDYRYKYQVYCGVAAVTWRYKQYIELPVLLCYLCYYAGLPTGRRPSLVLGIRPGACAKSKRQGIFLVRPGRVLGVRACVCVRKFWAPGFKKTNGPVWIKPTAPVGPDGARTRAQTPPNSFRTVRLFYYDHDARV